MPAVQTKTVTVKVPVYAALPYALTTPAPMPAFPQIFTYGAWTQYTLDLQTALKIDIDKLGKIRSLQPNHTDANPPLKTN